MDKRAFQRVPAKIAVNFHCNHTDYVGVITNISENGMFISTNEMCSPFNSQLEVMIPFKGDILVVSVNLTRIILSPDSHDGIGVKVANASSEYLELLEGLKAA